jgi:hypothetical protein
MGASPSETSNSQKTSIAELQAAEAGVSAPQNDYVRQIRDSVVSKATGTGGVRMAGDRLSLLQPITSMAEEAATMKYSPEKVSKAPGSQYLAYSSYPVRTTGA